jgi:serine acetyltransferase
VHDVVPGSTVVGIPARSVARRQDNDRPTRPYE